LLLLLLLDNIIYKQRAQSNGKTMKMCELQIYRLHCCVVYFQQLTNNLTSAAQHPTTAPTLTMMMMTLSQEAIEAQEMTSNEIFFPIWHFHCQEPNSLLARNINNKMRFDQLNEKNSRLFVSSSSSSSSSSCLDSIFGCQIPKAIKMKI